MKFKNMHFNLQMFAEETNTGTEGSTETNTESKTEPKAKEKSKEAKQEVKYTDADVNEIINKKFAEWASKRDKAVEEAKKLERMNAQEKAEYERDQLKKELDSLKKQASLVEMTKTARKMLTDEGINISDDLLGMMVNESADETKLAVNGFAKAFKTAVEEAVKERLKGTPPKKGGGAPQTMTKEQIMAIRDPELRQKKMLEHRELFNL